MWAPKLGSNALWKGVDNIDAKNFIHCSQIHTRDEMHLQGLGSATSNRTSHYDVNIRYP